MQTAACITVLRAGAPPCHARDPMPGASDCVLDPRIRLHYMYEYFQSILENLSWGVDWVPAVLLALCTTPGTHRHFGPLAALFGILARIGIWHFAAFLSGN